jgi:hypothetical protein
MGITRHDIDVASRVLIYEEDGLVVAHALDFDLIGCGRSKSQSLRDLRGNLLAQVSLCLQTNSPGSLLSPAPEEYIERWYRARASSVKTLAGADAALKLKCVATFICVTADEIRAHARTHRFELKATANEAALATA